MLEVIEKSIDNEMRAYAVELQEELTKKYIAEFNNKMTEHRNLVVLNAMSRMKIECERDFSTGNVNVMIRM